MLTWLFNALPVLMVGDGGAGTGEGEGGTGDGADNDGAGGSDGAGAGGADAGASDWRSGLPEDIRDWHEAKEAKEPEQFFDYLRNQRKFMGQSLRIPGEDAGDEQRSKFKEKVLKHLPDLMPRPESEDSRTELFKALGRPEEADGYKIPEIDTTFELDHSVTEIFKPIALQNNLTQEQFDGVVTAMTQFNISNQTQQLDKAKESVTKLKEEWGVAFDQNYNLIRNLAEKTDAPPALLHSFKEGMIGVETGQWLHKLAKAIGGEGSELHLNSDPTSHRNTTTEAKAKIDEVFANKKHAYWDKANPGHASAVKRVKDLYKEAYPVK